MVYPGEGVLEMVVYLLGLEGVFYRCLLGPVLVNHVQVFYFLVIFCLVVLYVIEMWH